MKKATAHLKEIKLAGLKVRTGYQNELNWEVGKIFPCVRDYFHKGIANLIPERKNPGTTFCAYTDYTSDHTGEYTYFIGEEVDSFDNLPKELEQHTIPAQTYSKFTTEPGAMPDVVKEPWQKIWAMKPAELGGKRAFSTDFEIYDERASDHQKMVLDIYIGIEK